MAVAALSRRRLLALALLMELVAGFRPGSLPVHMGLKGFGAPGAKSGKKKGGKAKAKTAAIPFQLDRSRAMLDFYDLLQQRGAGIEGVGVATFDLGFDLRGVVALRDYKKGEALMVLPAEAAVDLGTDSTDPTGPALELLRRIKASEDARAPLGAYFRLLPAADGSDCRGAPDFWPDASLDAPGLEAVAAETRQRRAAVLQRFENEADASGFSQDDLFWATWIVSSRVLTVQGNPGEPARKLLIPFLDMCNHERGSPQLLSGRAAPGGQLKVIAGRDIASGEHVTISYGDAATGNDRFLQDYGFLDPSPAAYDVVVRRMSEETRSGLLRELEEALPLKNGDPAPHAILTEAFQEGVRAALKR